MTDLTVLTHQNTEVVDSREVATMIEKQHYDLIKSIRGYCKHLIDGDFTVNEYFIENTYQDSIGRTLPCYLCTRKGCDMIANKLTGKKGVLFTAKYVSAFEKMQKFILEGKQIQNAVPFTEQVACVDIIAKSLNANDASKILMYHDLYKCYGLPTEFLPKYELNGSRELKPATTLLKQKELGLSAIKFNEKMVEKGFLQKKSRQGSKGSLKYFNALTDEGLKYGENAISPYNQKETQPLYYVDTFEELFLQIG